VKVGDLVYHETWGNGIVVQQQGVVNRWHVRFITPIYWGGDSKNTRFCWEHDLEVLSESR
jgi:hypothetical protein